MPRKSPSPQKRGESWDGLAKRAILVVAVWEVMTLVNESPSFKKWHYITKRTMQAFPSLNKRLDIVTTMDLSDSHPVYCYNTSYCCGQWNVTADHWWQHHPNWEVVLEHDTGFCLAPMQGESRTAMLQHLHWTQWNINISLDLSLTDTDALSTAIPHTYDYTVNCSSLCTTVPISSGYGASLSFLYSTFWYAYTRSIPFQIRKRGPWLYATPNINHTWAYCKDQDFSCFYLPVSPCSRNQPDQPKISRSPNYKLQQQVLESLWLRDYMIRPQQKMRHQLYHLKQPYVKKLQDGCIALHVRRSDAGVLTRPFRRYAPVQEYLDLLPKPANGSQPVIFLLTDDATTIDEVHKYHNGNDAPYKWVFTDKKRNIGVEQGFDGHIPKGSDGPQELLYITIEQELAARHCNSFVHGVSGYANILWDKMQMMGVAKDRYYLDTTVPQEEVSKFRGQLQRREAHLLQQVQEFYANRSKKMLP